MPDKFDISLYDEDFFLWHKTHAREYSIKNMDWYIDKYEPKSLIDFGCGIGSYLESAYNHGLFLWGYEISEAAKAYTPEEIQPFIKYQDCTLPMKFYRQFDCVISFETAEHIEPSGTEQFIQNLVNATGDKLLFTAAPPGQAGTGHINLHYKEFWIEQFSKQLTYNGRLTKEISKAWGHQGAPYYIVNNLIVLQR